jgi:biopolymer transport protein ExbD
MATLTEQPETSSEEFDSVAPLLSSKRQTDDEMDITPMIDMTFLLLIFFLVCSTPEPLTSVELPKARYGKGVGQESSVIITVGNDVLETAPVYLADGTIETARLTAEPEEQARLIAEAVTKGLELDNKEGVLIKADRNVAYREVNRVVKSVSQVEGAKIFLAVFESD